MQESEESRHDGRWRSIIRSAVDGITGFAHNLTDRAQLEERLRASEARWRAIVDSAVDAIIVIDRRRHRSLQSRGGAHVRVRDLT